MQNKACKVLSFCCLVLFSVLLSVGQTTKTVTSAETNTWLKSDPTLSQGFRTSNGTVVKVVKPKRGGYYGTFTTREGTQGTITVVGPPTVLARGFLGDLIDLAIAVGKKLFSGEGGGDSGGGNSPTNNNNGCININFTGSEAGKGATIIINGNNQPCRP